MGDEDFYIDGMPEFIAPLDKLVNNTVDFAEPLALICQLYGIG